MTWHGSYHKGAARELRANKREQAEARNVLTPITARRSFRREIGHLSELSQRRAEVAA